MGEGIVTNTLLIKISNRFIINMMIYIHSQLFLFRPMTPRVLAILLGFILLATPAFAKMDSADIYSKTENSVFQIRVVHNQTEKKSSIGSGFTVVQGNIIATNYHVISGYIDAPEQYKLEYLSRSGEKGQLEVIDIDIIHDLAVLKAEENIGEPLEFGEIPEEGARIFSLGNPLNLGFSIIEGVNNGIRTNSEEKYIHVSASLNPGMSGGPTLDDHSKVIGINVATQGNELSFLVAAKHLTTLLDQLEEREFKAILNIQDTLSDQLVVNSQNRLHRILENEWGTSKIGKLIVPSLLSTSYHCWDASQPQTVEDLSKLTSSHCTNNYNIFLNSNLDVGGISYEYHWLETDQMIPARFYRATYVAMNSSVPANNAGANDVTNFSCITRFIKIAGSDFKASICRRDYHKYVGLSDVLITMAMVGKDRQGFIFNLDLVGSDFDSAMSLFEKITQKIQWQK